MAGYIATVINPTAYFTRMMLKRSLDIYMIGRFQVFSFRCNNCNTFIFHELHSSNASFKISMIRPGTKEAKIPKFEIGQKGFLVCVIQFMLISRHISHHNYKMFVTH